MKRLQSNLAYLAAIADRSHKPSSQIPAHPAMMLPPPIKLRATNINPTSSPNSDDKEEGDTKKPETNAERIESLKDYYKQLQALFPGVDPNKEPPIPQPNPAARMQAQQQQMAAQQNLQANKQPQMSGQALGSDLNPQQQKMQQELLRQKMMQQQHAQNQMTQGMQGMNSQPPQNR
jgi:hypothetical protein